MKDALVNHMETQAVLEENLYSELAIVYQRLEKELTQLNPGCNTCGTCCNFSTFGHVLYTSSIEVDYITQYVEVPDFNISDNVCPFLKDNQCSIRDIRTLGCRIYYCNPHYKDTLYNLYEKYHHVIKELSKKYNGQWKYLPFLSQLAELKSKPSLL